MVRKIEVAREGHGITSESIGQFCEVQKIINFSALIVIGRRNTINRKIQIYSKK